MNVKVYTLNSFSKYGRGGNPAGIVLDADFLSEQEMQRVAKLVNLSETAFVQRSDKADFKVRFFTPNGEVDLCGHATIATFYLLAIKNKISAGKYLQETKAGILNIEVKKDKVIFMNQTLPKFYKKIEKKEIADALNISEEWILSDLPIQIVSTGIKDILIPIISLKVLHHIRPNFRKVALISKKYGVIGFHLFTLETKLCSTAHCRNLAPLYDIPEESATGTSNGALSCYLFQYKKITKEQSKNLVFEQGYSMNNPSEILAVLTIKDKKIIEVKVGGTASNIHEKNIEI
jgi:PhzF family phenazine biosynthesis protein